jgi:hypothetical protein
VCSKQYINVIVTTITIINYTGSAKPMEASPGYYTSGGASTTIRDSQVRCEAGSYCVAGVKYACPAGTYGRTTGLRCVCKCIEYFLQLVRSCGRPF